MTPEPPESVEHAADGSGIPPHTEARAAEPAAALLSDRARARLAYAGKAFVVTSLLAAAGLLIVRAQRHQAERPDHLVDLSVWNVVDRPRWSTLADVREIRESSGLLGRALPLYDRSAADIAREALDRTPRARRVVSITRVPPDRVDVVMEMRRPVAAVALPDGRFVEVDDEAVVLDEPSTVRPVREDLPLRVVSGAIDPVPSPGGICSDDVREGLRLCRQLDGHRDGLGEQTLRTFDEVDVSNYGGRVDPARSELILRAAPAGAEGERWTPCAVEWGRLGTAHGEPPFDAKVARLETAVRTFGDFDGIARVLVAFSELSIVPTGDSDGDWVRDLAGQTRER